MNDKEVSKYTNHFIEFFIADNMSAMVLAISKMLSDRQATETVTCVIEIFCSTHDIMHGHSVHARYFYYYSEAKQRKNNFAF